MENYSNEELWFETYKNQGQEVVEEVVSNDSNENENAYYLNDGTLVYEIEVLEEHKEKEGEKKRKSESKDKESKKIFEKADTTQFEKMICKMEEHYKNERNNTTNYLFDEIDFNNKDLYHYEITPTKEEKQNKSGFIVSRILFEGKIINETELYLVSNYFFKKYHVLFNKLLKDMFFVINLFDALKAKELVKSENTSADYKEYDNNELFKDYSYTYERIEKFIKHCKEHVVPKKTIYNEEWGKEGLFRVINKIFNYGVNLNELGYYTYQNKNKAYIIFRKVYNDFLKEFVSFSDLFTNRMLEIISNYNSLLNALRMRIGEIQNSQKELEDWLEKLNIYGSFNLDNFKNLLKENKNFKNCFKKFLQFYEKIKNKEKLDKYNNLNNVLSKAKYFENFKNNKIDFESINDLIKICNQENIDSNDLNELINKCCEKNNLNCLKELITIFTSDFMKNYPKDVLNNTKNLFVNATIRPLREAIKAIESHFYEIVKILNKRDKLFSTYTDDPNTSKEFRKKFENYNEEFLKKNEKQLNIISNNRKKNVKDNLVISDKLRNSNVGMELQKYLKSIRKDVNSFTDGYDDLLVRRKNNKEDKEEKKDAPLNVIQISNQEKVEETTLDNATLLAQINAIGDDNNKKRKKKKKKKNNEISDNLNNANEVVEQKEDLKDNINKEDEKEKKDVPLNVIQISKQEKVKETKVPNYNNNKKNKNKNKKKRK